MAPTTAMWGLRVLVGALLSLVGAKMVWNVVAIGLAVARDTPGSERRTGSPSSGLSLMVIEPVFLIAAVALEWALGSPARAAAIGVIGLAASAAS
ncbi:MAG: hypothetical protein AB7S26_14095 [Sandaracinaceae bacterium]